MAEKGGKMWNTLSSIINNQPCLWNIWCYVQCVDDMSMVGAHTVLACKYHTKIRLAKTTLYAHHMGIWLYTLQINK